MSGGSFQYLFSKDDLEQLLEGGMVDLVHMAEFLQEIGEEDAAAATREVLTLAGYASARYRELHAPLADLWKAVEWECSCDTVREDTLGAIEKWRAMREAVTKTK